MTRKRLGALALFAGTIVIFVLPAGSIGALDLRQAAGSLKQAGEQVQSGLGSTVQKTGDKTAALAEKTKKAVKASRQAAKARATATDPPKQPPLHGTNPHGQGTVGVVDLNPSAERPLDGNPDGSVSGEDIIVGRARGEQNGTAYHGHITIAALFGKELSGVDSTPGQANKGPLQPLQAAVLDPLCDSTKQNVCLSVLRSDSTTTQSGSINDFAVARAGLLGLQIGAAESQGNIASDANCQTSAGAAKTANVKTTNGTVASAANSTSSSKSCRGQAPVVTNTSQVLNLGGAGVPIPAAGCANGTPDTDAGVLPPLLPIICNADEIAGAAGVRDALDVFALQVGTGALLKESTGASESVSVAPAETGTQCSDGKDNDGDGKVDIADPGCHTDGNANNASSFDATDNDETDVAKARKPAPEPKTKPEPKSKTKGNSGSGGGPECSDGVDNDGDGVIDSKDPGCHTDGNANNAASYNPDDNSEAGGAGNLNAGSLPFTGTDVIGISLAGLLMLAGGLMLRRREDVRTVR